MNWVIFAFLTAICESIKDVFSKRGLRLTDEYIVSWAWSLCTLVFLSPLFFFIKIPDVDRAFWLILLCSGLLNLVANLLFIKAIKSSDLSLTIPMITFTPLFLLITSPLMLHEFPAFFSLIGILLIVAGSYVLNVGEIKKNPLAPIQALLRQKGPRLMLLVAFIWSISGNLDKLGVRHSSALFWPIAVNAFIAIGMIPVVLCKSRSDWKGILQNAPNLVPIGFCIALGSSSQMLAISLTQVTYVISVKRMSVVFGVLFGTLFFKEKGLRERLAGAMLMVVGVVMITLLQAK